MNDSASIAQDAAPVERRPLLVDWMTRDECARELGISPHTLKGWEQRRTAPPSARIGSRVLYHRTMVQE
jgi:hypothetical protein